MKMLQLLPLLAYAGCAAMVIIVAVGANSNGKKIWLLPTLLALVFAVFTTYQVSQEGLVQFWINHTTNLTGNQVWFDLVMAIGIGFYLLAPRARSVGMSLLPWGIAVIATACIALLPMLARVLWLESKSADLRTTRSYQ